MPDIALGNIQRVLPVDMANVPEIRDDGAGNFVDEQGFFIRAGVEGYITFCPINNKTDAEAITKLFTASAIFVDPVNCRKIFSAANSNFPEVSPEAEIAGDINVGYGV
jgi:hypothetical protein